MAIRGALVPVPAIFLPPFVVALVLPEELQGYVADDLSYFLGDIGVCWVVVGVVLRYVLLEGGGRGS